MRFGVLKTHVKSENTFDKHRCLVTTVKENDTHMAMDHTRRGLLRVATVAGIGAILLPGIPLLPIAQASTAKPSPPAAPVMVNGWLLKVSDR